MLKILLRQKFFNLGYRYEGHDEQTGDIYQVHSGIIGPLLDRMANAFIGIPFQVVLEEKTSREFLILKKRCQFMWEKYDIFAANHVLVAKVRRSPNLLTGEVLVETVAHQYRLTTGLMARTFKVFKDEALIGEISKKTLALKDNYQIDCWETKEEALLWLAFAVILDNVFHA